MGSSRARFGASMVARALRPPQRVLHTRQDLPSATVVPQIDPRSSLRDDNLPGGITSACFSERTLAVKPLRLVRGRATGHSAKTMRSGWLARTAFVSQRRHLAGCPICPPRGVQPHFAGTAARTDLLIFVFSSPTLGASKTASQAPERGMQISGQKFLSDNAFSEANTSHPQHASRV